MVKNILPSMFVSSLLTEGEIYSRADLAKLLDYKEQAFYRGVFTPKKFNSILLFVTEVKSKDKTPYYDLLNGEILNWDGETKGGSDNKIINHMITGDEILLFYRKEKNAYRNYGFNYVGRFEYVSHEVKTPTHFILRRIKNYHT